MTREDAIVDVEHWNLTPRERETLEAIIPELRESEDERIRKELIEYLRGDRDEDITTDDTDRWIAWLEKQKDANKEYWRGYREGKQEILDKYAEIEKQKEQKPVERSLEDDHIIGFIYDLLNEIEWKDNWAMSKDECLRLLNNYSPQKPVEWSEEDEEMLDAMIDIVSNSLYEPLCPREGMLDWLKSLRPQLIPASQQGLAVIDHLENHAGYQVISSIRFVGEDENKPKPQLCRYYHVWIKPAEEDEL